MQKQFSLLLLVILIFSACDKNSPTHPEGEPNTTVVFDSVDVRIYYDNTPGFLQPALRHEVYVRAYRKTDGLLDYFWYQSQGEETSVHSEYGTQNIAAGTKFDSRFRLWTFGDIRTGMKIPYTIIASSFTFEDSLVVGKMEDSLVVEVKNQLPINDQETQLVEGFFNITAFQQAQWVVFQIGTTDDFWRINGTEIENVSEQFNLPSNVSLRFSNSGNYAIWKEENQFSSENYRVISQNISDGKMDTLELRVSGLFDFQPGFRNEQEIIFQSEKSPFNYIISANIETAAFDTLIRVPDKITRMHVLAGMRAIRYQLEGTTQFIDYSPESATSEPYEFTGEGNQLSFSPSGKLAFGLKRTQFPYGSEDYYLNDGNSNHLWLYENGIATQLTFFPGDSNLPNYINEEERFILFISQRRGQGGLWRLDF